MSDIQNDLYTLFWGSALYICIPLAFAYSTKNNYMCYFFRLVTNSFITIIKQLQLMSVAEVFVYTPLPGTINKRAPSPCSPHYTNSDVW